MSSVIIGRTARLAALPKSKANTCVLNERGMYLLQSFGLDLLGGLTFCP